MSPEEPDGTELVLEPDDHRAVKPFKRDLGPVTTAVLDDTCGNLVQIASAAQDPGQP